MLSNSFFFEIEGAVSLELGVPFSHPLNAACVEECKPSNLQETYVAWLPKKNTLLKQESRKKPTGKEKKFCYFKNPEERREEGKIQSCNMNSKEKRNNPDKLNLQ
jgi:hypothetical protein